MKRTILLFATMACMTITSLPAQEAAVNKIIETGRSDNQVMNHLDILTNRFGGRPIGSDAYDNATEWVASKFKEWGLEVELQEAGILPVGFNRGPWFGKLLGENGMELHFVTPSYTSGTKGLQRGHVLLEPLTQDEFDRMKGQLKGAWVLVNGKNTSSVGLPRGDEPAARRFGASCPAAAGLYGALRQRQAPQGHSGEHRRGGDLSCPSAAGSVCRHGHAGRPAAAEDRL